MTQKILAWALCSLLAMLFLSPYAGYCAEQNPRQFIKNFYTWYITTNKGTTQALKDNTIYKYVEKETVEHVKNTPYTYGSDRRDYFLKIYDPPLSMNGVIITVGQVTDMGGGTFVALVTIITDSLSKERTHDDVVMILRKTNGALKIIKCVDVYPEA